MEGLLSIIIPSYNEGLLIDNTADVVVDIMTEHKIPYEILFVDDVSLMILGIESKQHQRNMNM